MTTTTAVARKIHLSAQKGRLVADQIRGLPVAQALNILHFSRRRLPSSSRRRSSPQLRTLSITTELISMS